MGNAGTGLLPGHWPQMTAYVAYGVRLESEITLPGLPAPCGGEPATIKVLLEEPSGRDPRKAPAGAEAEFLVDGRPLWLHVNGDLEIGWENIFRFRMNIGESLIRCSPGADGHPEHIQDWLLHYALPLLLVSAGRLQFLHGSAVQVGHRAVGFLAPSGGGKTTLAQYFLQRGHEFFTDEKLGVVACGQGFVAVPSTPFYRRGEADARWQAVSNFASAALPLDVLYVLVPAAGDTPPVVTPVPAREAAFELARRCEFQLPRRVRGRLRLPPFQEMCFQFCTDLAAAVRVCRLVVPRDRAHLPEVYDTVVADVAEAA